MSNEQTIDPDPAEATTGPGFDPPTFGSPSPSESRVNMSRVLRKAVLVALSVATVVVSFMGMVALGLIQSNQASASSVRPEAGSVPAGTAASGEARFIVALVLGQSGTDTADALAPYEVLASSAAFHVYTVSASRRPAALDGGLAVAPDYTFTDVTSGAAPTPDLIVVPAVSNPDGRQEQATRTFVATQYKAGAHILGICAGSRLLAASGILDGLDATSHWSRISALASAHPEVTWVRGQRYVQDGRVTTTGGVTFGIPGTLKMMADLAGKAEASRIGLQIAYPGWRLDAATTMPKHSFTVSDAGIFINFAFPWSRPTVNVELQDGVGEIDAAALFEVYSYSQAAATNAVSEAGRVTTRHGLTLLTRLDSSDPATETVLAGGNPGSSGFGGFDAAFEQLGRSVGPDVMSSVSKMLEYPLTRVSITGAPSLERWRAPALLATALFLSAALGMIPYVATRAGRRRLGKRQPSKSAGRLGLSTHRSVGIRRGGEVQRAS